MTCFTASLLNNIYSVNLKTQALNSALSFNWCGIISVEKRLKNCGCLSLPKRRVHFESQRIKASFRNSFKFLVSWDASGLYFLFSWTQLVLKHKVIDMQYCLEPVHPVTCTVQSFWSDHSSVYLYYFHLNQPSGPSLKSEAICPNIFKNTYQHVRTRHQMWQLFPSCHILEALPGWTCLGCCFQFHLEAEDIWSKDEWELMFYKVPLQCVQSVQQKGRKKCIKWEEKGRCFATVVSALWRGHNVRTATLLQTRGSFSSGSSFRKWPVAEATRKG